MANPAMTWTTVKAYSPATATESAPTAGSLTNLPTGQNRGPVHGYADVALDGVAWGGTSAATSVVLAIYREVGGKVQWLYDWTISKSDTDAGTLAPIELPLYANKVGIRLKTINGGTAPTFTATVLVRETD